MSPIDRVSQRAQAFTVLGVSATATKADIRRAYRKLAFEQHPDRNPDCSSDFARVTEAYQFVTDNAELLGIQEETAKASPGPRRMSRPQVRAEETEFDEKTIAECQALIDAEGGPGTLHIASALYRVGRNLTYFVPSALAKGRNEVAVPTGVLNDSRRVLPKIIAFESIEAAGVLYRMPQDLCAEHFPGARSIQLRFISI